VGLQESYIILVSLISIQPGWTENNMIRSYYYSSTVEAKSYNDLIVVFALFLQFGE
jgi:hypothetical protein